MKIFYTLLIIVGLNQVMNAQFHFGGGGQLMTEGTIFGLQGKMLMDGGEDWKGAATFTYHLDKSLTWSFDLDGQYKLLEINDSFNVSPLAGMNIVKVNGGDSRIGLNLGVFLDFIISENHIYIEPKYIIRKGSTFALSGGVYF